MTPRTQEWRTRALALVSEAVAAGCIDLVCNELRKVAAEMPEGDAQDRLQALELGLLTESLKGPVVLHNDRSYREWAENGGKLPIDPVRRDLVEGVTVPLDDIESPVAAFDRILWAAERDMNLLNTWDHEDKP